MLAGCQSPPSKSGAADVAEVREYSNTVLDIRALSEAELASGSASIYSDESIPDLLYEALQALSQDRLLTPVDNNAHARFKRVLARDPQNELALQGLQDIVKRYLQLSQGSMRRGLFDEAHSMLDKARFVDASHPQIAIVAEELRQEMNSKDLFYELDYPQFAARSESAVQRLSDIARQAKQHEAFFLITSPNDDLARWMVSVMREAVDGYRLRGNIELGSSASIRLKMPESE